MLSHYPAQFHLPSSPSKAVGSNSNASEKHETPSQLCNMDCCHPRKELCESYQEKEQCVYSHMYTSFGGETPPKTIVPPPTSIPPYHKEKESLITHLLTSFHIVVPKTTRCGASSLHL